MMVSQILYVWLEMGSVVRIPLGVATVEPGFVGVPNVDRFIKLLTDIAS